jgi:hypothetical protein
MGKREVCWHNRHTGERQKMTARCSPGTAHLTPRFHDDRNQARGRSSRCHGEKCEANYRIRLSAGSASLVFGLGGEQRWDVVRRNSRVCVLVYNVQKLEVT